MKLHIFNPENDLALADGGFNYCPPPAAMHIAKDLASLPLWFAAPGDAVMLQGETDMEYHSRMSEQFGLPKLYESSLQPQITSIAPWGWSPQMRHRVKSMGFAESLLPSNEEIASIRTLSNRKNVIEVLSRLSAQGIEVPPMPVYVESIDSAAEFVNSHQRSVVKAPWSGSGKGILWGIGSFERPMEQFCRGIIRRQGGLLCEHYLNAKVEFAMEFLALEKGVEFIGYSLFNTENGAYSGNILATEEVIEAELCTYIPKESLQKVKGELCRIMCELLKGSGYYGYFGIDMMVYDNGDGARLNPCMEINLRMNMGITALIFYNNFVSNSSTGKYRVEYFKNSGEAFKAHCAMHDAHPLATSNGKITEGYINLSPVTTESKYMAYAIMEQK